MKYTIEYEEIVRRTNSIAIDVDNEKEGEKIKKGLSEAA